MKTANLINKLASAVLGVVLAMSSLQAQDYKHPHGLVDKNGKITNSNGQYLGWVTLEGTIKDTMGINIAQIDSKGNLVDAKTKKTLGHSAKNETFVYFFSETKKDTLTTLIPMNGTCEVKNSKGNTVLMVHENYKQYGACAYHCLNMKKQGMKMK